MKESESIPEEELGLEEFRQERRESMMFADKPETEAHLEWIIKHPDKYGSWIKKHFGSVEKFHEAITAEANADLKAMELEENEDQHEAA